MTRATRMTITLESSDMKQLRILAERNYRRPHDQARFLICDALTRSPDVTDIVSEFGSTEQEDVPHESLP